MNKKVIIFCNDKTIPVTDLQHYFKFRNIDVTIHKDSSWFKKKKLNNVVNASKDESVFVLFGDCWKYAPILDNPIKIIYTFPTPGFSCLSEPTIRQFVITSFREPFNDKSLTVYNTIDSLGLNEKQCLTDQLPLFGKFISGLI